MKYLALLRGINVGGNKMIKMAELRECLEVAGFENVQTYIQSGNIIFESSENDRDKITETIEKTITKDFGHAVPAVVLSQDELEVIVDELPEGWMGDEKWKYNYLFLKTPYDMDEVISSIGNLKPQIETLTPGKGVIYQAILFTKFGQTTSGKLASMPVYQIMTIRNHNTVTKLFELMKSTK